MAIKGTGQILRCVMCGKAFARPPSQVTLEPCCSRKCSRARLFPGVVKRNQAIVRALAGGTSVKKLAAQYRISGARVRMIAAESPEAR